MFASKTPRTARRVRAVLGAAVIACFAWSASAAEVRKEKMPSNYAALQKMKPLEVMHMIDTDKDGFVTREEFMKFQEAVFEKIDKNKDRRLEKADFTGAQGG
jgi:hypothetical protein